MASVANNLPSSIRLVIADDHPLFRDGLRRLLQSEPGYEVVGEASDGDLLVDLVRKTKPDILLLDLSMPRQDGMEVLRELSASRLPVRTLLLTASIEKQQIVQALKLGAYGVIMKESTTQRLFDSIQCVMAGQYWVGRESVSDLVRALRTVSPVNESVRSRDYGLT
ncbi:MAG TPA: response regulator transcription factor, partial [Acidobacteriaceae bacterium]|nr:response regulator transcription factor [Acidobacteriaceae bacterium]